MNPIPNHQHNGIDSNQLSGNSFAGCPLAALTPQAGSLTTGGAAVLSSSDAATIMNTIDRLNQLEAKLRLLGFIL